MLFDILDSYVGDYDLPIISGNYEVLYFDEFPMLFTGTNEYTQRVIGSLMCEDEERDIFRYMYILVKKKDYSNFLKQKISYRQLIEQQKNVFLLDKDFEDNILRGYYLPMGNIPPSFLPQPDLLCPNAAKAFGSEFAVSLIGGIADAHEALVSSVSQVSKTVEQILVYFLDSIGAAQLQPEVLQRPFKEGSFVINFVIKTHYNGLFFDSNKFNDFVSNFVDYSLNSLTSETVQLAAKDTEGTKFQSQIENKLIDFYGSFGMTYGDAERERLLKKIYLIPEELEKVTSIIGDGFEYLDISSYSPSNQQYHSIGVIDNNLAEGIAAANYVFSKIDGENEVIDDVYRTYMITVFGLNKKTRNGNAYIANDGKIETPKIKIEGAEILEKSKFIKSMDLNESIEVSAKSIKVNGRFKKLIIRFD